MPPAPPSLTLEWFAEQFDDLRARMEILDRKVSGIQRKDQDMSDALTRLTASVGALLPVVNTLVTAVAANDTEMATLANNLRNRTNPDDSASLNALADQVDQMRANLSTANGAAAASLAAATATGATGDDTTSGGDTVSGSAGDDTTSGGAGNDSLSGGDTGTDTVTGSAGDDTSVGAGAGDDTVSGAAGDDTTSGA